MDDYVLIQQLKDAGAGLDQLIDDAVGIIARYLPPDGISADDAIDQIIGLLDSSRQRVIQQRWMDVAGADYSAAAKRERARKGPDEQVRRDPPIRVVEMPSRETGKRRVGHDRHRDN